MSATKKRVFINHGWDGKPDSNWFPWLREELEQRGFEVMVPQMPNAAKPKLEPWINTIAETIGIPDENLYFVGHSLGCVSVVRYLERLPLETKVGGCVFVAPFAKDIGYPELKEFIDLPVDFERVKAHSGNFVVIASRTDGYVPLDTAIDFQMRLEAELITEQNMGHFSDEDGIVNLEIALQSVLKMADWKPKK